MGVERFTEPTPKQNEAGERMMNPGEKALSEKRSEILKGMIAEYGEDVVTEVLSSTYSGLNGNILKGFMLKGHEVLKNDTHKVWMIDSAVLTDDENDAFNEKYKNLINGIQNLRKYSEKDDARYRDPLYESKEEALKDLGL